MQQACAAGQFQHQRVVLGFADGGFELQSPARGGFDQGAACQIAKASGLCPILSALAALAANTRLAVPIGAVRMPGFADGPRQIPRQTRWPGSARVRIRRTAGSTWRTRSRPRAVRTILPPFVAEQRHAKLVLDFALPSGDGGLRA